MTQFIAGLIPLAVAVALAALLLYVAGFSLAAGACAATLAC